MAKRENTPEEPAGGLTVGLNFKGNNQPEEKEEKTPYETTNHTKEKRPAALKDAYKSRPKKESRTVKLNILVKPSTAQKLDAAVDRREIKSRNDLINFLLERYLEELDHKK